MVIWHQLFPMHVRFVSAAVVAVSTRTPAWSGAEGSAMAKTKRQRDCGGDRIDSGHIQKFLERANAGEGYLTRAQLVRFLDHPDGPILPDACVEMRRLPADFRTHGPGWAIEDPKRSLPGDSTNPIKDITVRPTDGALCIATVRRGMNIVVCSGDEYALIADKPGCKSNVRILGFHPVSRLPVTHLQMFAYHSHDGCTSEEPGRIFNGGEFTLEMPHAEAKGVTLLSNGDVLWLQPESRSERWRVWRNGQVIMGTEFQYTKFVESPRGRILGIRDQGDLGPTPEPYPDGCCVAPINNERHVLCNGIDDVVVTREGYACIRCEFGVCSVIRIGAVYGKRAVSDDPCPNIGSNHYIAGYTELPDGRAAYIGEMKHSELPCWVIAGKEQVGFMRMSPLFQDGERWCYWGVLGRRLYKMEIPAATATGGKTT